MTSATTISDGCRVTLYFSLALPGGELIDSNYEGKPATCRIGDGDLLPGFEACLQGLVAGDEVEVTIPADEAFGALNNANLHRIPRDRFNRFLDDEFDALEAGAVVTFRDPAGFDLPGVIKEKSPQDVLVDFNHPLAGKDIVFRARIVSVISDDTQPLDIKV